MKVRDITVLIILLQLHIQSIKCDDSKKNYQSYPVNNVNTDGTFHFGYDNKDQGGHYHKATGSVIKVRGRYGSRNAATGKIDETVYTAGARGYRARGANIHRKQNLSQIRRGSIGSPNDPLADPSDDPSYSFGYKTKSHSRREESDTEGKVHGEFIYVDDAGDKHGVKYKAGAHAGFQVENGVPDTPSTINYNAPLYRADPTARGKISFERGPDRQYKFLTSSPDQRRSEATGPDGITRGSYSYLDDKGVQRTVQYIAGAGIGYKVLSSTIGPGSHVSANADVPEYSIKAVSNEIAISDEPSNYYHHTGPSAPSGPGYVTSTVPPQTYVTTTPHSPTTYSTPTYYPSTPRPFSRPNVDSVYVSTPSSIGDINHNHAVTPTASTPCQQCQFTSGGPSPLSPSGPSAVSHEDNDLIYGLLPPREEPLYTQQYVPPTPTVPTEVHITPAHHHLSTHHHNHNIQPPSIAPTPFFYPTQGYLPTDTPSPYSYIPTQPTLSPNYPPQPTSSSIYQPQPTLSSNYQPHPTLSSNYQQIPIHPAPEQYSPSTGSEASSGWFYGLATGAGKRAHIQNIDLMHERAPSPSEALRRDEERDQYQTVPQHHQHQLNEAPLHYLHPPPRV
ncbi:unnamed protein product [Chironomus riparius]|uniref:Uncharacterized protein n=1 Tax=Chironomus riparius TaxID=315576 RepID=A0A9N9RMG4_9DIPT|nr:unnamed protein product [Chironomus riparius]